MKVQITPEMSGQIPDESHFDFHVTCKAKIINAVNKLKKGKDFLTTLSKLKFSTNKLWTKNSCGDPSVKALLEILEEYKKVEHRPSRAAMLVPIIEYAIALYASDLFFRERGSWFICRIIDNAESFKVCRAFKPDIWYPARCTSKSLVEYEKTSPSIEKEYRDWYYVDVNGDTIEIPDEIRQRVIEESRERMKANGLIEE